MIGGMLCHRPPRVERLVEGPKTTPVILVSTTATAMEETVSTALDIHAISLLREMSEFLLGTEIGDYRRYRRDPRQLITLTAGTLLATTRTATVTENAAGLPGAAEEAQAAQTWILIFLATSGTPRAGMIDVVETIGTTEDHQSGTEDGVPTTTSGRGIAGPGAGVVHLSAIVIEIATDIADRSMIRMSEDAPISTVACKNATTISWTNIWDG
jgi:hypothetical protein